MLLEEVLGWPRLETPLDLEYVDPENGMNIFHRIAKKQTTELFEKLSNSVKLRANTQLLVTAINTPM